MGWELGWGWDFLPRAGVMPEASVLTYLEAWPSPRASPERKGGQESPVVQVREWREPQKSRDLFKTHSQDQNPGPWKPPQLPALSVCVCVCVYVGGRGGKDDASLSLWSHSSS